MKRAFIDIGTNTVLLLLVDVQTAVQYRILKDECRIARLGEGLSQNLVFTNAAKSRVLQTLQHYKDLCYQHECHDIYVVGTAAFRKVKNGNQFVEEIFQSTGLSVQIISGEEEARLVGKATVTDFQEIPKPFLTLDIGGGSTEFVVMYGKDLQELKSFPFGAVRLYEEFLHNDPPSQASVLALRHFVRNEMSAILTQFINLPQSMVATAGTPTTVAALLQNLQQYNASLIHKSIVKRDALELLFERLVSIPLVERQMIPCLPQGRADVILAGCLILSEVMQAFGFDKTYVSDRGLRHGLLLDTLE